jgi:hypothetical protein
MPRLAALSMSETRQSIFALTPAIKNGTLQLSLLNNGTMRVQPTRPGSSQVAQPDASTVAHLRLIRSCSIAASSSVDSSISASISGFSSSGSSIRARTSGRLAVVGSGF